MQILNNKVDKRLSSPNHTQCSHRVVESHVIVMELERECLELRIVDDEVEDFLIVRILCVPNRPRALCALAYAYFYVRVHFA